MNLPNKITMMRITLSVLLLVLLIFPFYQVGVTFPTFVVGGKNGNILVDSKYFIAGALFLVAAVTDFLDGYIARKYNLVTDFGKVMDAIADKMLVNGVLIILAVNGFISVIVPVVIVIRDIAVDSIKMVVGKRDKAVGASILGKIKTIFMLIGLTLLFFYNLPFELINLRVADFLILVATVLSVVSGVEYYIKSKKILMED
jgi:CDP-diacylglycerol---glycerol-3-phosphate 3-phosphatidyltransferase